MGILAALAELEEKGLGGVLCTIVETRGSTPRHEGSKMLVYPDGHFIGTVGGGEVENRVREEAAQALRDGKTRLLHYNMIDPKQGDPGVCGGQLEIFVEPYLPQPTLLIIGGGHVGKAVAHLGKWLGFRIAVSDDRVEYCTLEENPDADLFYPIRMEELPGQLKITPWTFMVLTTRGMAVDVAGMPALLDSEAAYIGVIGSKRRWISTKKALINQGVPEEKIKRVVSPIGLELKAETPEEIAVSIMAQIIMLRNGGTGQPMQMKE